MECLIKMGGTKAAILEYLSRFVELVDVLNVIHDGQLVLGIGRIDVINQLLRLVSESTSNLRPKTTI